MKNIKILLLSLVAILTLSCSDDDNFMIIQAEDADFKITSVAPSSTVLNATTPNAPVYTLVWNEAKYDQPTPVTYHIEVSKTEDFASFTEVGNTTDLYFVLTHVLLNTSVVESLGLIPFTPATIYARVKSTIGVSDLPQYSQVQSFSITPYTTDLPKIAVPGNHQSWNPATAPLLASSAFGATDYEGYVQLDGEFKFVGPDASGNFAWGNTDWGDDGSFSGVLVENGETNCTATAGYYLVKANTGTLTYSTTLTNWGIIGSSTPSGWDNSTAMTYDATTKKWKVTLVLSAGGEIKFRANNAWDINLGADSNDNDESMDYGGSNIPIATGGTYLVELDLSNPRNYKYTLTLQ